MSTTYLHGIEVLELASVTRPLFQVDTSVIGLVGTAPLANASAFPLNTPTVVPGTKRVLADLGTTGTLPNALDNILDQGGAKVVVVRVTEGANAAATRDNVIGGVNTQGDYTGISALLAAQAVTGLKPKILIAPGFTDSRVPDGVISINLTNGGSGYTSAPTVTLSNPGAGGIQARATATVSGGQVTALTITNPGAGYGAVPNVVFSGGGGSGAAATATIGATRNPVVTALEVVANRLLAVVFADCPNTGFNDAVQYRNDWNGRIMPVYPAVVKQRGGSLQNEPFSSIWAGVTARTDATRGVWKSPSNENIFGISAFSRSVDYAVNDAASLGNLLNGQSIGTYKNLQGGFMTHGNRMATSDSRFQFLAVRRLMDYLYEILMGKLQAFQDEPINKLFVESVCEAVNAELRQLKALGAIINGNCWADATINTPESIAAGQVFFDFDVAPAYPADRITVRAAINNAYLREIFV